MIINNTMLGKMSNKMITMGMKEMHDLGVVKTKEKKYEKEIDYESKLAECLNVNKLRLVQQQRFLTLSSFVNMDKKFCFGCQLFKDLDQGKNVVRGKIKRWVCNVCLARKNTSTYASKKKVLGRV